VDTDAVSSDHSSEEVDTLIDEPPVSVPTKGMYLAVVPFPPQTVTGRIDPAIVAPRQHHVLLGKHPVVFDHTEATVVLAGSCAFGVQRISF
jgi:hypothetical protein